MYLLDPSTLFITRKGDLIWAGLIVFIALDDDELDIQITHYLSPTAPEKA